MAPGSYEMVVTTDVDEAHVLEGEVGTVSLGARQYEFYNLRGHVHQQIGDRSHRLQRDGVVEIADGRPEHGRDRLHVAGRTDDDHHAAERRFDRHAVQQHEPRRGAFEHRSLHPPVSIARVELH